MILLWRHDAFTEQVFSSVSTCTLAKLRQPYSPFFSTPRSFLSLTPASPSGKPSAATNIPHLHTCSMSSTLIFSASFSRHDTVATFLHYFMHRFPHLLMNDRFLLILSPLVPRYPPHPFPYSPPLVIVPNQIPALSIHLWYPYIVSLFAGSLCSHVQARVYIYIDPRASNLSVPLRVICLIFLPSLLIIFFSRS